MNKITKSFLDAVWYLVAFVLIQVVVQFAAAFIWASVKGQALDAVLLGMANGVYGGLMVTTTAISSLLTILLFTLLRWTPVSRNWLASRPWLVIVWVVLLTFGTILPSEWIYEQMQLAMPEQTVALFQSIMREPWGYLVVGMLVPVAEELVFRAGRAASFAEYLCPTFTLDSHCHRGSRLRYHPHEPGSRSPCHVDRSSVGLDVLSHTQCLPWYCDALDQQHSGLCHV